MSAYATEFAQEGSLMATSTPTTTRTAHLLDLMKQGDDAFNNRDVAAMDAIHHLDMIAHVTGSAEPIYGSDDDNA